MSSAFDDLIGESSDSAVRREPVKADLPSNENARRLKAQNVEIYEDALDGRDLHPDPLPNGNDFLRPVSANFIAECMGKQVNQIRRRLAPCRVVGHKDHGGKQVPYYDFFEALSYLIEPKGSIDEWFASKNAATLPPYVNKMFWDSAHQRNRVMRSSNDLWHTEDVKMVLGRVALTIKEETRLWVEELPGRDSLTDEQFRFLLDQVNQLQNTIRDRMLEMPSDAHTRPMSLTIKDELEAAGRLPESQGKADE